MLTADEIGAVVLFARLEPTERERLSRVAADIALAPGDYAAHEGDERALFAVLAGRIEVTRLVDGIPRVIGERLPGDVFGEVPIALGTPFPVGFRAAENTRVMRLEARDYHAAAAVEPNIVQELGKLARDRMSGSHGLQSIVAEPQRPRALVLGDRTPECSQLRRFLERNQITFTWVQSGTADAEEQWGGPLPTDGGYPLIRVVDGETVAQPPLRRVAELLGLATEPRSADYDTVIVGAGPAGLAAGVYGASEGLQTIVVEREAPGGQAGTSSRIENYLGFPSGVSGGELATRALQQAQRLGAEILVTRSIAAIDAAAREVQLDDGDVLRARTLIIACGVAWRQLSIEGFDRLTGKGIAYGAARSDAPSTHGLDIHIVGAGNSAGQAALFFSAHARSVTILCRGEEIGQSMSSYLVEQIEKRANISTHVRTEIVAAHGDAALEAIDVRHAPTGKRRRLGSGGVFVFIGADAETGWLPQEIALDRHGYVLTGSDVRAAGRWELERDPYLLETSVPGIFACGDVRSGPVKRVAAAVGEGSMAIAFVHQFLRSEARSPAAERLT
jgi:thioredoxin reductase (NADPH)